MLTVVTSGKAAPGVTTAVWALARRWPRPLLLADCDVAGGDLAGGLPGQVDTRRSLLSWSAAGHDVRDGFDQAATLAGHVVDVSPAIDRDVWLLPGYSNPTQGASFNDATWGRLAAALSQVGDRFGRDVLVDTGRMVAQHGCWPVLRAADVVLLTVRCTLRSVHAARDQASRLNDELGGLGRVKALVVAQGPYPVGDVLAALGLELGAVLAYDPETAGSLSDGIPLPGRVRQRSPLLGGAGNLAATLTTTTGSQSVLPVAEGAAVPA